ncbi:MAG TPA: hypothetical protein VFT81_05585 [Dermatophilaceae bacterium]|nr:hypothetical protein [Dermatophilaceae bacterium]
MTRSPVPQEVAVELRRVVERWQQLPLDHALSRMPLARDLVQSLADRVAGLRGSVPLPVPDLGPAIVIEQLRVMVYDVCAADPEADSTWLVDELRGIRQAL